MPFAALRAGSIPAYPGGGLGFIRLRRVSPPYMPIPTKNGHTPACEPGYVSYAMRWNVQTSSSVVPLSAI